MIAQLVVNTKNQREKYPLGREFLFINALKFIIHLSIIWSRKIYWNDIKLCLIG